MEQDLTREVDLHQVKRVVEVRASAANELLEAGWILHNIYFTNDGDYHSNYILVSLDEPTCSHCGSPVKLSIADEGERVRYICSRECSTFPQMNLSQGEAQEQSRLQH